MHFWENHRHFNVYWHTWVHWHTWSCSFNTWCVAKCLCCLTHCLFVSPSPSFCTHCLFISLVVELVVIIWVQWSAVSSSSELWSYIYGLYDLGSAGWQLNAAEFDRVSRNPIVIFELYTVVDWTVVLMILFNLADKRGHPVNEVESLGGSVAIYLLPRLQKSDWVIIIMQRDENAMLLDPFKRISACAVSPWLHLHPPLSIRH